MNSALTSIRVDRLKTLIAFLIGLDEDQMNMNTIIQNVNDVNFKKIEQDKPSECGAIGCAIGWAGLLPEFRNEGLKYTKKGDLKLNGHVVTYASVGHKFFGLSEKQTQWFFGPLVGSELAAGSRGAFLARVRALEIMLGEPLR